MPHERKRYLSLDLEKALGYSPIVGILGQRQTGKTTLMEQLTQGRSVTFDDPLMLKSAQENARAFLRDRPSPFGIDECQFAPELFPALKVHVKEKKSVGQFVLTGSVRFTSRKLIRESLTGRIVNFELLPFTLAESHEKPLGDCFSIIRRLHELPKRLKEESKWLTQQGVKHALMGGGLPGICFYRDPEIRRQKLESHIETLLERDLRLIYTTTLPYLTLRGLLQYLAEHQGAPLNLSELSRKIRVSTPTLRKLLSAYEALFLVRRIQAIGDRSSTIYYLEDQGMASHLSPAKDRDFDLQRALFSELQAQNIYRHKRGAQIASYLTRGGAQVPLVISSEKGMLGFIPLDKEVPDSKAFLSAQSFLKRYPKSHVIILANCESGSALSERLFVLPQLWVYL